MNWFLRNPEHEPDRVASGLEEGLQAVRITSDRDWQYADAEPLADPALCERVEAAVQAAQLARPDNWEWGHFRVRDRIVAVHMRPASDVRIDGPGPRAAAYVLDPAALDSGGAAEAVTGVLEAKWWPSRPR